MSLENTKLCDFSNTNNNDFISTSIAPATSVESYEINAALLNLVMIDDLARNVDRISLEIDSLKIRSMPPKIDINESLKAIKISLDECK